MNNQDEHFHNIRIAKIDDAIAISEMVIRNIIHFHKDGYTDKELQIWQTGYSVTETQKQIKNRETFVLENKNKICGMIQLDSSEIKGFYIDPKYKGRGFGKRLLHFMLSKMKQQGSKSVELTK